MHIWELTKAEIDELHEELSYARENGKRVRFAFDDGLKVKVGEDTWTAPLGELWKADH